MQVAPGEKIPINLQLKDGRDGFFPMAVVKDSSGNLIANVALSGVGNGLYLNRALTMPQAGPVYATYYVYTDLAHTLLSSRYVVAQDTFEIGGGGSVSVATLYVVGLLKGKINTNLLAGSVNSETLRGQVANQRLSGKLSVEQLEGTMRKPSVSGEGSNKKLSGNIPC